MANSSQTNFAVLQQQDPQLLHLGMLAEKYFADDPNTCLLKLRQLAELLAQLLAARIGQYSSSAEKQYDCLRRLQDSGVLPREVFQLFDEIRRAGNAAQPKSTVIRFITAANDAAKAVQLGEADTRKIIDRQLRQAGWEVDSETIKYNKGARPEKNRHRAIAEWPTEGTGSVQRFALGVGCRLIILR